MTDTQIKILKAGREEFLDKGYIKASLRTIAKNAGVSTGAIYGLYRDKMELFSSLVEPYATDFTNNYLVKQEEFKALDNKQQIEVMYNYSTNALQELLDYIYLHFDAFKLLICCSAGTKYEKFIHTLVDVECKSTYSFYNVLKKEGYSPQKISENLVHILSSAYFAAIFETVEHDMDKDEADEYVSQITSFFHAGWERLFSLK
ncbi:MAG: TetR/AcrR family transcriptional regulator [Clostridiales bacterium]|nr:TetR/AcrR family transcriptional regulator [Clostridiales bacterium]